MFPKTFANGLYVPRKCVNGSEERKLEKKKTRKLTTRSQVFSVVWTWLIGGFNFTEYHPTKSSETEDLLGNRDRGVDPEVMKKYGSGFLHDSSKV